MTAIGLLERIVCPFHVLRERITAQLVKIWVHYQAILACADEKSNQQMFFLKMSMRVSTVKACNVLIHTANLYM